MKIDSNIEPSPLIGRGKNPRWPFDEMEIGDSVAVTSAKDLKAIRNAAYLYRLKHEGFDYGSVKEGEGGRLWRIS